MASLSRNSNLVIRAWNNLTEKERMEVLDFMYDKLYNQTFRSMMQSRAVKTAERSNIEKLQKKDEIIESLKHQIKDFKTRLSQLPDLETYEKKINKFKKLRKSLLRLWGSFPQDIKTQYLDGNTIGNYIRYFESGDPEVLPQ
jgi:hypothetical protein